MPMISKASSTSNSSIPSCSRVHLSLPTLFTFLFDSVKKDPVFDDGFVPDSIKILTLLILLMI
ncbi:BnaC04g48940D [Brassica napus]|uniref:BnaC04g48940D protein n=1 Tax=Brassica napus TaxID=3708 RepID=A0A078GD96_BRANA|nr:BnaC04g48940D [Brassica napus]